VTAVLLTVAVAHEAVHLPDRLPVLLTGIGKVNAAMTVAAALSRPGPRPELVVNLGTAGALHAGMTGTHEVGLVVQHDLDSAMLEQLTGSRFGPPIRLGEGPTLATGDVFVTDPVVRDRLAQTADLVDMEGYAVAAACQAAGVPVRVVKHVSDSADAGARTSWVQTVEDASRALADWVSAHVA
jgi:adenosylhomocysteine nucleosidase